MSSKKKKKKKKPFLCYLKTQQKKQPFKNTSVSSNKPLHLGKQQKKPWPSRPSPKSGSHCSCPSTSQNLPSSAGETRDLGSIPGSKRVGHDWATELNWTEHRLDIAEGEVSETEDGSYWNKERQRMKNKRGKEIWGTCGSIVTCMWLKSRRGSRK